MELINEINKIGLSEVIKKYCLLSKYADNKVLLKYSQIDSHPYKYIRECRQARGIILELNPNDCNKVLDTPISFSFERFFNYGEFEDDQLIFDWNNYTIEEKKDGSLIVGYWDTYNSKWQAATSGTIYGEAQVHSDDHYLEQKQGMTFADLFWEVANHQGLDTSRLYKKYVYIFELCTPDNQVVVYHKQPHISLLTVRERSKIGNTHNYGELDTWRLQMISGIIKIPLAKRFKYHTESQIIHLVNSQTGHNFEGVVLKDSKCHRIKVKNEDYVNLHHNMTDLNDLALMKLLHSNEVDEATTYFPHIKNRINDLRFKINLHIRLCMLLYTYYNKFYQAINKDRKTFFKYYLLDRKFICIFTYEIETAITNQTSPVFNSIETLIENGEDNKIKTYVKWLDNFLKELDTSK